MENQNSSAVNQSRFLYGVAIFCFVAISTWYFYIHSFGLDTTEGVRQIWGSSYQILALFGGIVGFFVSKRWSGHKSLVGRAIMYFSAGLLLQSFGQSVNSYYNFFEHQTIPYPSLGDIGFMGSVVAYISGAYLLMKVTGFQSLIKTVKGKIVAIGLPLIILLASYFFFLQGYEFDWTNKIKILLDFGYPFGQAFYVSLALLAFFMSRNFFGGIMKRPMFFLVIALIFQYVSDFTFLYQANAGTWYVGGMNDFLYAVSYFVMALAIIYIGTVSQKIKGENTSLATDNTLVAGQTDAEKILNQIVVEIIQRQDRIAGQIAWEEAKKVSGLVIVDQSKGIVTLTGDPKKIIDQLVKGYQGIFGVLAAEVSKNAARYLVAELPDDQVPESIR